MAEINDKYRKVIHLDKTVQNEERFITVTNKSGVQWASCNTGVTDPRYINPGKLPGGGGHGKGGVSWVAWLFIIPGAGIITIGSAFLAIGSAPVLAATVAIEAATLAAAALSYLVGSALWNLAMAQIIGQLLVNLGTILPGSQIEFVKFEKPCSEDTGVDF